MRLFAAIDVPDAARSALAAIQRTVVARVGETSSLRIVRSEHLHLTLVFIGEVEAQRGAAIAESMAQDLPHGPFEMVLGGLGVFPLHGRPQVLWMGVTDGRAETVAVQQLVARRLEPLGVAIEPRPFAPHLTLARWKRSRPAERGRALSERTGPGRIGPERIAKVPRFPVQAVTLYQSVLSSTGPSYRALARAPLVVPLPGQPM